MRRLVLLGFLWGWSFLLITVATRALTPVTVAAVRTLLGAAVLFAVVRARGVALPRDRDTWRALAIVSVIGAAVPLTLLSWSSERITSALIAVLNTSTPLFTAVLAAVFLRERLAPGQLVGLAIGIVGVSVAVGVGADDLAGASLTGGLAVCLAGLCYAGSFITMGRRLGGISADMAAGLQLALAGAILVPFAAVSTAIDGVHLTPWRLISLVVLGIVNTGWAWSLNFRVVADLGATRASLVGYLIPLVGVTAGVVVLGEPFRAQLLIGGALILLAVTLVNQIGPTQVAALVRRRPGPISGAAPALAMVALALTGLTACGDSSAADSTAGRCQPAVRERLDAASGVHLLPNAAEPTYLTDPPTSGPHLSAPRPTGLLSEPLSRPAQVNVLEGGAVLIQYRSLDPADRQLVDALATDTGVVVAPNPDLASPVVATAWTWKQSCDSVDVATLQAFIDAHVAVVSANH